MKTSHFYIEWRTLQLCHEQHERNALHIKLASVSLFLFGIGLLIPPSMVAFCMLLLWAVEAVFKTYQHRIAKRLLHVEALLAQASPDAAPMQLHTEWALQRPGTGGLLASYARSACKPTVAFPYVLLVLMSASQLR